MLSKIKRLQWSRKMAASNDVINGKTMLHGGAAESVGLSVLMAYMVWGHKP